jgi:hypothetical protein
MNSVVESRPLQPLIRDLLDHPVYQSVHTFEHLRCFMAHHVFAVWDFMSRLKALQQSLAPATVPWRPTPYPELRRLVNEIVLEAESDQNVPGNSGPAFSSHFEIYLDAMREVRADTRPIQKFLALLEARGLDAALESGTAPVPCVLFMRSTFEVIQRGNPHEIAAAFALGRESVVPGMFRALLDRMGISSQQAPSFYYYLQRHTHLDEETHGPLARKMLETLCARDPARCAEAELAAAAALRARISFWDGVLSALPSRENALVLAK